MQFRWVGTCGLGCWLLLACGESARGEIAARSGSWSAADSGVPSADAALADASSSSPSWTDAADSGQFLLPTPEPVPSDEPSDTDGDGLSDDFERAHESDPERVDSDGDGVSDLAEWIAKTDPTDKASLPASRGDFYFVTPFDKPPTPARDTLQFSTELRSADLFILVDTTGSMGAVLAVLQQKLSTTIVPQVSDLIADLHIGVGTFEDVPQSPYGYDSDKILFVSEPPTADAARVQAAVNALVLGSGGDGPEGAVPALYALATGQGLTDYLPAGPACDDEGIGYACFRPRAVPIVLLISDAEFHNGPAGENPYSGLTLEMPSYDATLDALRAIQARVISIRMQEQALVDPAAPSADAISTQMLALSRDTGAVTEGGDPLFFEVDQTAAGLDDRVVDAVRAVAQQVPIKLTTALRDDPDDDLDATQLVERVEVHVGDEGGVPGRVCTPGLASMDSDDDGADDTFTSITPGTPVCFDVKVRKNRVVPPGDQPAVFRAFVDVVADDKTVVDTHALYFLVPAAMPVLE